MLVDVKLNTQKDPVLVALARAVGDGDSTPVRLTQGVYEIKHFNFDHELGLRWNDMKDQYPELTKRGPVWLEHGEPFRRNYFGCYGICDNYQQVVDQCVELQPAHATKYVMSVTCMRKKDQSSEGGWRWHKWGEYIGTQKPTTEYLYDEPVIEEVYCYHIYKVPPHLEIHHG